MVVDIVMAVVSQKWTGAQCHLTTNRDDPDGFPVLSIELCFAFFIIYYLKKLCDYAIPTVLKIRRATFPSLCITVPELHGVDLTTTSSSPRKQIAIVFLVLSPESH